MVAANAVLPSAHTAMLIGQGLAPSKGKAAEEAGRGLFTGLKQAQAWAEGKGSADGAGEDYWTRTLGKNAPKTVTVSLPGSHTQHVRYLGKLPRKLRRIFGVVADGTRGAILAYRRKPDLSDLDAPVLADKRSPGSKITRRDARTLWLKHPSQNLFAEALSTHLGQPVSRSQVRTILDALKPFLPSG